jgi:hypothetical protein
LYAINIYCNVNWNPGKISAMIWELTNSIYLCDILSRYIMKTLSLKLDDNIFNETEDVLTKVNKSRNRYINEAVDYYNRINKRNLMAQKLAKESRLVKKESIAVLSEFESLPDEI